LGQANEDLSTDIDTIYEGISRDFSYNANKFNNVIVFNQY